LALDGVFAENATAHLLYRSILLPFAKTSDKAECVLGSLQFRRVQARGRIASGVTRTKAPLPVRLEQVQPVQNLLSVTYPEQFRTALSHARQHAAKLRAEETTGADQIFAAMRSGMRRAIWPRRVTQCVRSAPAIGKAVLSEQHSEFALLLARRVDATSGRYEIVS